MSTKVQGSPQAPVIKPIEAPRTEAEVAAPPRKPSPQQDVFKLYSAPPVALDPNQKKPTAIRILREINRGPGTTESESVYLGRVDTMIRSHINTFSGKINNTLTLGALQDTSTLLGRLRILLFGSAEKSYQQGNLFASNVGIEGFALARLQDDAPLRSMMDTVDKGLDALSPRVKDSYMASLGQSANNPEFDFGMYAWNPGWSSQTAKLDGEPIADHVRKLLLVAARNALPTAKHSVDDVTTLICQALLLYADDLPSSGAEWDNAMQSAGKRAIDVGRGDALFTDWLYGPDATDVSAAKAYCAKKMSSLGVSPEELHTFEYLRQGNYHHNAAAALYGLCAGDLGDIVQSQMPGIQSRMAAEYKYSTTGEVMKEPISTGPAILSTWKRFAEAHPSDPLTLTIQRELDASVATQPDSPKPPREVIAETLGLDVGQLRQKALALQRAANPSAFKTLDDKFKSGDFDVSDLVGKPAGTNDPYTLSTKTLDQIVQSAWPRSGNLTPEAKSFVRDLIIDLARKSLLGEQAYWLSALTTINQHRRGKKGYESIRQMVATQLAK